MLHDRRVSERGSTLLWLRNVVGPEMEFGTVVSQVSFEESRDMTVPRH